MDDVAQRIVDNETGYRRDLREAEEMIVAAGNDPVKIALGMRRHSEAVRNMMIAEMIPSFQKALKPLLTDTLDDKLAPVVVGIGGLQAGLAHLNSEFQSISEVVNQLVTDTDHANADRKAIRKDVKQLQTVFAQLHADFIAYQSGSKRADVDVLKEQVAEIRGNYTSEEREKYTKALLAMLDQWIADNPHG
mgnify:CR=1 FL=1